MWPFKKKVRQRRLEARRGVSPPKSPLWRRFAQKGGIAAVLLASGFYLGALLMDVWPVEQLPYRLGQYVPRDIHARVKVRIPSREKIDRKKSDIEKTTPAVFQLNHRLVADIAKDLRDLPARLQPASQPSQVVPRTTTRQFAIDDERILSAWRNLTGPQMRKQYDDAVARLQQALPTKPIVKDAERRAQYERKARTVRLADREGLLDKYELIVLGQGGPAARELAGIFPPDVQRSVEAYLREKLSTQAIYSYDAEATQEDIRQKQAKIEADPPEETYDVIQPGQAFVGASRKQRGDHTEYVGLSEPELLLLAHEQRAFIAAEQDRGAWHNWMRIAGRAAIILLVVLLLCAYVGRYHPNIGRDLWRDLNLTVLLLLLLAVNKALIVFPSVNPHASAAVVMMAVIVLVIAYDQRFARAMGVFLAILLVLQLRAGFSLFLVLMTGLTACVFQLREVRTRSKLIRVSAISAAIVFLTIWAIGLSRGVPWVFVMKNALWAALPALLAGFLAQGILPGIERIFRTATSMTLLEWCDASKPLLKRLATEAPGTYNHSLQLGSMCETAAESVGARGLLARVGAYYHDIGKMNKPQYFVENQAGSTSKHAKLSPAMSLLIITAHVKDGLELAREYGLPAVLHEFISTHHGTTLVHYFFQAAAEQRKSDVDRAPDEVEFRYPGPKPRSKEAGILMLADASESSVRAMSEPTPGRIENQVHTMVSRRLMDGQLEDCDLTLREVHQIESSIVKSLCSIYHSRIAYPTPAGQKPSAAETTSAKRQGAAPEPPKQDERDNAPPDKPAMEDA